LTDAIDLTEEHLGLALPGHLGELVHRGDEDSGELAVNLLIDDEDGYAVVRGLPPAERTLTELVAAVDEGASSTFARCLDVVAAGAELDLRSAPGAVGQLVRRAAAADCTGALLVGAAGSRLERLLAVCRAIWGCGGSHPEPDAERGLAPAVVATSLSLATEELAGTDQGGRPLELLEGQEPQRVPHQHRHAVLAGTTLDGPLQAADGQREGGEPEVGFRL